MCAQLSCPCAACHARTLTFKEVVSLSGATRGATPGPMRADDASPRPDEPPIGLRRCCAGGWEVLRTARGTLPGITEVTPPKVDRHCAAQLAITDVDAAPRLWQGWRLQPRRPLRLCSHRAAAPWRVPGPGPVGSSSGTNRLWHTDVNMSDTSDRVSCRCLQS